MSNTRPSLVYHVQLQNRLGRATNNYHYSSICSIDSDDTVHHINLSTENISCQLPPGRSMAMFEVQVLDRTGPPNFRGPQIPSAQYYMYVCVVFFRIIR
jgi:hypothetical protein